MPMNYSALNALQSTSLQSFIQTYQTNPANNIATAYYNELQSQANSAGLGNVALYADIAKQVTTDSGAWGVVANKFSQTFAGHLGHDFSVGSTEWLTMQWSLMQADYLARTRASLTGELDWGQTTGIHQTALSDVGLPANVYSLAVPLQATADLYGAAVAQSKFEAILHADHTSLSSLMSYGAESVVLLMGQIGKDPSSLANWEVNNAETLWNLNAPEAQSLIGWIANLGTNPPALFAKQFNTTYDALLHGVSTGTVSVPGWGDWIKASVALTDTAPQYSPLVLDLDGDGVELTALTGAGAAPVYWDMDNDGFAEASAWVKSDDGLLARDVNGNGRIDGQNELFGSSGTDGFAALSSLDSNGDNQITAADAQFSTLRIWRDLNQDGISQPNELQTLSSLGITSINRAANTVNYQLAGNQVSHDSTFVMNGQTRTVVDAWFKYDGMNTTYSSGYTLKPEAVLLPIVRGYGNVPDLVIAMSQNAALLDKVKQVCTTDIAASPSAITSLVKDVMHLWAGVSSIDPAARGTASSWPDPDARDIAFVEKLTDHPFSPLPTDSIAGPRGMMAEDVFREMQTALTARLLLESSGAQFFSTKPVYDAVHDTYSGPFALNMTAVNNALAGKGFTDVVAIWSNILSMIVGSVGVAGIDATTKAAISTAINNSDPNHLLTFDSFVSQTPNYGSMQSPYWQMSNSFDLDLRAPGLGMVLGVGGIDLHMGTAAGEFSSITGQSGKDTITLGLGGNDTLGGGQGNDLIYGGDGDDTIQQVSRGVNKLYGGNGNDTFLLNGSSDKQPGGIVDGGAGVNQLVVNGDMSGLSVSNIQTMEVNSVVALNAAQLAGISTLTATNGGVVDLYGVSAGTYDISAKAGASTIVRMHGSTGNDTITGNDSDQTLTGGDQLSSTTGNDFISGMGGSDTIYGGDGDDKIGGGAGKDSMYGEAGNDVFQVGGSEVVLGEIIDGGTGANLLETWGGDLSLATITNVQTLGAHLSSISMTAAELNGFTSLYAYDGVPVTIQAVGAGTYTIETKGGSGVFNLTGTSGNDTLTGNGQGQVLTGADGGDVLTGLGGADSMYGGNGNDWFKVGGTEVATGEIIDGGAGVDTLETWGGNLSLATVTSIETLAMHAGTVTLTAAELAGISTITIYSGTGYLQAAAAGDYNFEAKSIPVGLISLSGSSFIDTITGSAANDTLAGNGGADTIRGRAGNDAINGGTDHDWLYGESGADTINGGTGNDRLDGGTENDLLFGDDGTDIMRGGAGNDTLDGGNDDDRMKGEAGNDLLTGGAGIDKFLFAGVWNSDTVTDFVYGTDKLYIEGFVRAADGSLPLSMLQIQMHVDTDGDGALDDLRITVSGNVDKVINLQNFDVLNPTVTTIDAAILAETNATTYTAVETALAFT